MDEIIKNKEEATIIDTFAKSVETANENDLGPRVLFSDIFSLSGVLGSGHYGTVLSVKNK